MKDIDEEVEPLTAKEFVEFAKELYTMSDSIKGMDEDDYPTFVQVLSNSRSALKSEPIDFPKYWNNSMDHWLFAIIMETEFGLGSWKTYELDKVNPIELETTDLRVAASLHRGINFLRNEWFYLADQAFTQNLVELEKKTITFQPDVKRLFSSTMKTDISIEEQFRYLIRATTYLLRGFSRHQTGDSDLKEKALKDVESAITDFSNLGIDNELVWIAESYVFIKNEDSQKAINSLTKLEKSPFLTGKEKKLLAQIKQHIKKRDSDSALNFLTDKVFMYKLGVSYAISYAAEIEWMQLLEKTEEGKRILARFKELEQIYEKGKKHLDLDALAKKGERLFKEFTKQDKN